MQGVGVWSQGFLFQGSASKHGAPVEHLWCKCDMMLSIIRLFTLYHKEQLTKRGILRSPGKNLTLGLLVHCVKDPSPQHAFRFLGLHASESHHALIQHRLDPGGSFYTRPMGSVTLFS